MAPDLHDAHDELDEDEELDDEPDEDELADDEDLDDEQEHEALLEAALEEVGELAFDYQDPADLAILAEGDPDVVSLVRNIYLTPSDAVHFVAAGITEDGIAGTWAQIRSYHHFPAWDDLAAWHEAFPNPLQAAWVIAHGANDLRAAVALAPTVGWPPDFWDVYDALPDEDDDDLDEAWDDGRDDPPNDGPHPWS